MKGYLTLAILLLFPAIINAQSRLELSEIFSDHMVLQREQPIRIWGWASTDSAVTVYFHDNNQTVKPDENGKWMVEFLPMQAGGPYSIRIESNYVQKTLKDVYVGDVWIGSGQSNMEWPVVLSANPKEEIANSDHPMIRHIKIQRTWDREPQEKVLTNGWDVASPETTGDFTAVGYYFARELRKHVDVPIGIINTSWGGSRIEPWMRNEIIEPYYQKGISFYLDSLEVEDQKAKERMLEILGDIPDRKEFDLAMSSDYDDSQWIDQNLPGIWEDQGFPNLNGLVWLRKEFELSREEAGSDIQLGLGKIDDSDSTFVNGKLAGVMRGSYNIYRKYTVPSEFLKEGTNAIMIQVEDVIYGGGLYGEVDSLYVETITGRKSLTGPWKLKVENPNLGNGQIFQPNQLPTLLYNKMISPITDFPIKGVLWYQGESNAAAQDAVIYRDHFKNMITDWRTVWAQGDFPFFWVQLTNYSQANDLPVEDGWGMIRESQTEALSLPNTAQAVIIDIGDANDIHPKNKQDVGYRLSLAARKLTYGDEAVVHSGPLYKSMEINGDKVELSFDHIGSGLMVGGELSELKEFAISDDGVNFVHARAIIEGEKVTVWSDGISRPKHVRYAWKMNPSQANLFNKEGLPASPFRTDKLSISIK